MPLLTQIETDVYRINAVKPLLIACLCLMI